MISFKIGSLAMSQGGFGLNYRLEGEASTSLQSKPCPEHKTGFLAQPAGK
jgi:hypothetical protein